MSYRIYNGTQLLGDVNNKSTGINGLLPATNYQFGVSNYDGNRESSKTTINVKTRGIRLIIPTSLTVNSTITLNYQEYSLGLAPIGTEPAGMFGGGNKRNIQAKVISVDNGKSTVELLEPLESSSTVSVGGKNLLNNTDTLAPWHPNENGKIIIKPKTEINAKYRPYIHSSKYIQFYNSVSSAPDGLVYNYQSDNVISLAKGEKYTISALVWYYTNGNDMSESQANYPIVFFSEYTNQLAGIPLTLTDRITGIPTKYSYTFECVKSGDYGAWRFGLYNVYNSLPGGSIFMSDVQLEKGTIPSDYGPSANDVANAISEVSQDLTNYKAVVRTATPMIGGGKNLARGTSDSWEGAYANEFNGGTNFTKKVADVYLDDLNVGDNVTVQITYQYSGVTSNNAQCWLQGPGDVTGWNGGNFYGGNNRVINMQTGTDVKHGSMKYTFTIDSDMKKNRHWSVAYRFDNVNKGAWFKWLKFKVERGSVATPWSPAPEDTQYIVDNTQMTKLQDGSFAAFNGYRAIYFRQ